MFCLGNMCMATLHKGNNDAIIIIIIITMYQNQSKQVMKVRLYYGTNKCKPTELLLTINRTS